MKTIRLFICKPIVICLALLWMLEAFVARPAFSITIKEEEELSREFLKQVLKQVELIKDPLITGYVKTVGDRIVSIIPPQPFSYHFYVIKNNVYNAFASPAGHIFINSGLLEAMDSEDELAGILSHEISHVLCRHISRRIEQGKKIGLATLAGVAAGIFLGAGGAAAAANTLTIGSMAAGQSLSLAYSREDEMQADQIGLQYLTQAGYSADGLLTIMKKIQSKQWFGTKEIPTYLRTHPAAEERIAYIGSWMERNPKTGQQADTIDPYAFKRVRARLMACYGDESIALKTFESQVANAPEDPVAHYGYAVILARTGHRTDALQHLQAALEKKPFDSYILKEIGKVYFQDGQFGKAREMLRQLQSAGVLDAEGQFFLGRSSMELGDLDSAAIQFEDVIEHQPDYTDALYFAGQVYGQLEKLGKAHYYLGRFYFEKEDWRNAGHHLRKAQGLISDPDRLKTVEEMLGKIRKSEHEMKKAEDVPPFRFSNR